MKSLGERAEASAKAAAGQMDPVETAVTFDGLGLVLTPTGSVRAANRGADLFLAALDECDETKRHFFAIAEKLTHDPRPVMKRLEFSSVKDPGGGTRSFDLTFIPSFHEKGGLASILVTGAESTFERNLTKALSQSRELFRDLVLCSTDLAFETDRTGVFTYVSPGGLAGFSAKSLNGRSSHALLLRRAEGGEQDDTRLNPFMACEPLNDYEIWIRGADGENRCLLVTALPAADRDGFLKGTRGIARDITDLKEREEALRLAAERDRLIVSIVESMRKEIRPQTILETALRELVPATGAGAAFIFGRDAATGDRFELVAAHESGSDEDEISGEQISTLLNEVNAPRDTVSLALSHRAVLITPAENQNTVAGFMAIAFGDARPVSVNAYSLAEHVAPHIGVALAQAEELNALERMSQTDELTGLANRRALLLHLDRALRAVRNQAHEGALLFLDMDDFKPINDELGHETGDRLLAALGARLKAGSRKDDVPARLGGDEFCIWLSGASREGALLKAQKILAECADLSQEVKIPWTVSFSIGAAYVEPGSAVTPSMLMDQADKALYQAKRAGKGKAALWADGPSPAPTAPCAQQQVDPSTEEGAH